MKTCCLFHKERPDISAWPFLMSILYEELLFFLFSLYRNSRCTTNYHCCCKNSNPYANRCIISGLYRSTSCRSSVIRCTTAWCIVILRRSYRRLSSRCWSRCRLRFCLLAVCNLNAVGIAFALIQNYIAFTTYVKQECVLINRISFFICLHYCISNRIRFLICLERNLGPY